MSDLISDQPELVPIDYSRYRRAELQDMCRDRGLPTSGGLPALIDRLGSHDQQTGNVPMVPAPAIPDTVAEPIGGDPDASPALSFLVEPDDNRPVQSAVVSSAPEAATIQNRPPAATPPPVMPASQIAGPDGRVMAPAIRGELVRPGAYQVQYPCPGDLGTETHNLWIEQTAQAAIADGHTVRGGSHRVGWMGEGYGRFAVYEVSVRKD